MGGSTLMPVMSASSPTPTAVRPGSKEDCITRQDKTSPAEIDPAGSCPADVDPARRCPVEVDAAGGCPAGVDPVGGCPAEVDAVRPAAPSVPRPVVQPLSPERYRVQFTIGQGAHDILRRLQTLLRREIPDGDAGVIFERALRLLHERVEAAKFGKAAKGNEAAPEGLDRDTQEATPITAAATRAYENRIRPGADPGASSATWAVTRAMDAPEAKRAARTHSRYIPKAVKRAVWYRDRGQCAFVSASGQRCVEQEFLELHHIQPYALKGPATAANIALRCRLHNAYEAAVVFGARAMPPLWPGRTSRAAWMSR
jgi:hypothetical protein